LVNAFDGSAFGGEGGIGDIVATPRVVTTLIERFC